MRSIDEVKRFWNNRPCNVRHSSLEIGTREYFEEVEKKKFFVEPHILDFTRFSDWAGKKVLEIGCGIGTAAINFAKNGAIYTGIDLSDVSVEISRKRFEVYEKSGNILCGDAERLSEILGEEKFDLIYSFGVIHHSSNPRKILSEAKKFMKEDSILKIMIYAKNSWKNTMIEGGFDQPEAQSGCPIALTYDFNDARELLEGFNIVEMRQAHIFPYDIELYKQNIYKKVPWFDCMPKEMFEHLEKRLGWHLLITAKNE